MTIGLIIVAADLDDIALALNEANLFWLIPACFCVLLYILCEGLVYKTLLGGIGTPITLRRATVYACTDIYFSALTPSASGGQPATSYYMSKDGISVAKSTSSIIIFLLCYKTVLIGYALSVLFFYPTAVLSQPVAMQILIFAGIVINVLILAFLVLSILKPGMIEWTVNFVAKILVKLHMVKYAERTTAKFSTIGRDYCTYAHAFSGKWRLLVRSLLYTFIQRTALFSVVWFVYKAFGGCILNPFQVMAYQVLISSSIDMLPLPGAMGATEISFLTVFNHVFSTIFLMPAMLVSRLFNYYLTLIISACVALVNILRCSAKKKTESDGDNK